MNTRFALIREKLGLTTRKFGERLNITGGAVTNMEKGTRGITERTISDVCREFNVNEEWLRNGTGEMFIEPNTFSLDEYAKQRGATDFDLEIVKAYFEMPKELREAIKEHFISKTLPQLRAKNENAATKEENTNSIDHEVEAYRKELMAESKGEILSVSEKREGA